MLPGKPSVFFVRQFVQICGINCTHQHTVPIHPKTVAATGMAPSCAGMISPWLASAAMDCCARASRSAVINIASSQRRRQRRVKLFGEAGEKRSRCRAGGGELGPSIDSSGFAADMVGWLASCRGGCRQARNRNREYSPRKSCCCCRLT